MAGSDSEVKECWYSVLGVERTATPEEIRSAYRKQALRLHPDKIQQSGASAQETEAATARFQTIVQAYEVLSDPVERSWYDKYRNEILSSGSASKDFEFNVFSFFSPSAFSGFGETGKGFYKVYKGVFENIHKKEQAFAKAYGMGPIGEAPSFGKPNTPYSEVEEFFKYWTGFTTAKDFSWCDEYQVSQAPNRKVRRLMEEENAKIRKKKRREFSDAVRDLATFVKKRDKRWLERQVELQKLQKEKELQFKLKKRQLQQEKIAKARAVQEQEWSKLPEVEEDEDAIQDINEGSYGWKSSNKKKAEDEEDLQEFYCIICSKRFRSDKQWKNHEKSKKHMERASALKQSFLDEDEEVDALVNDVGLKSDTNESAEEHRGMAAGDSDGVGVIKDEDAEEFTRARARHVGGAAPTSSESPREGPAPAKTKVSRKQRKREQKKEEESDEDEDETLEDDEDSMLAAMMNTFKTRLVVPPAEVSSPRDVDVNVDVDEGSDVSREQNGSGLSSDSDGEDDVEGNDEESLLASMLKSTRSQSRSSNDEEIGSENPEKAEVSIPEAECTQAEDEEGTLLNGNVGKNNGRRRSKAERQHMAAGNRHSELLKEISSAQNGTSAGELEDMEPKVGPPVEASENIQPTLTPKKKKLQRGQKKSALEVPRTTPVAPQVSQEREFVGKKGSAKSKKGKGVAKAANTCDTCGEDFESRSQLFRHISATSHATLKLR